MITLTSNHLNVTNPETMNQISSVDLFEVLPVPLLAVLTLEKDHKDIIFSIDVNLVIRLISLKKESSFEAVVYDCN